MNHSFARSFQRGCAAAVALLSGLAMHAADATTIELPPLPGADLSTVEILATDPTSLAGTSTAAFTLVRTGALDKDLTITFTASGTGVFGKDYSLPSTPRTNSVVIPANFAAQDIVVAGLINPDNRGNKTLILSVDSTTHYLLGARRKAAVSIVDDTFNDVPPKVGLVISGGVVNTNGQPVFTLPATVTLTATASDVDDKVVKVTFYADDLAIGSAATGDDKGNFSFNWVNPKPGKYSLFARAVDQSGKSTLSQPVPVVVDGKLPGISLATITAPTAGGNADIKATITAGSGSVAKVEFTGDGKALPAATAVAGTPGQYQTTWASLSTGSHTVTVTVTDSLGFTAKASTTFKVSAPVNQAPVVNLDAPAAGTKFPAKPTVTLTADATDPDNGIVRVAFYANGDVIGIVRTPDAGTKSKYTFVWDKPASGSYTIKVHATDELGRQSWSKPVLITVSK